MPLLAATNLKHAFGEVIILDGCTVSVEPGERIGLVGRNGTGKSTLMKALGGLFKPDSGDVSVQRGKSVGYLHQDPDLDPEETLRDAAEGAFAELHEYHRQLHAVYDEMASATSAELDKLMKRQEKLERQIEAAGGYAVDHKIDAVLHGLGFTDAQFSISVSGLSGGQKSRLALARLLLQEPDLVLLDEPTNHLDIEGRLWLEDFLKNDFPGAVMMISHDRYLLDNVVSRIIEIEQGRLIEYPGNYQAFRKLRAERREAQLRAFENQQTKFRHEEAFIRKYKAGQRAKQAKGRETRLERERTSSTLEKPVELGSFRLEFPRAERTGDVVISARGLSKRYPADDGSEKVLFDGLDIVVERGERWGIIGPNGAGKSTLVRCLLGQQTPDAGAVRIGANVKVGYYAQSHEIAKPYEKVYRYIQGVILKEAPSQAYSEQQARNLAGAFLFSGDEQEKEMGVLSGGERARAVLAGLLASAKNLLVLDEPTNHLDVVSAERLEEALIWDQEEKTGFEGTLILISHDRALIDATCSRLIVLDGKGGAETYLGNYSAWHEREVERTRERETIEADRRRSERRQEAAAQRSQPAKANTKTSGGERSGTPDRSGGGGGGAAAALERMSQEQLESRIEKIQDRIREVDSKLSDPDVWSDAKRCAKLGDERAGLAQELEPLEFEWSRRAEEA